MEYLVMIFLILVLIYLLEKNKKSNSSKSLLANKLYDFFFLKCQYKFYCFLVKKIHHY